MRGKWLFVVLPLMAVVVYAAENQAYWGMFAETTVQRNAGMPDLSAMMRDVDPSALANLPPHVRAMMAGGPRRRLEIRLWSPSLAPEDASATVVPPAGLQQGDRLELELYRPKPAAGTATGGGGDRPDNATGPGGKFTIKRYWGSSPTVKPGQPEVVSIEAIPAEDRARIRAQASTRTTTSYFYKPNWTTAFWPTPKQPGAIAPDASLVGTFTLESSYAGKISLEVPENVDFLAPIELQSPDLAKLPDLAQALVFRWKAIPNLLGSHARIVGMVGTDTLIIWSSSEVKEKYAVDYGYLQMAEVRAKVEKTQMMAGDRTDVTVPAGIFKDCDFVSLQMVGYGSGTALDEGQPLPRLQTKTTLTSLLGGKKMAGMGMGGGG